MMKVLIYGLGAVGGYVAANLVETGHDVTAIVRPHRVEQTISEGVVLREGETTIHAHVKAFGSLREAVAENVYDLLILSVKSYHLPPIVAEIAADYPHVPMVLAMQNGIGVEDGLIDQFGRERVLASAVTATISWQEDGSLLVEREGRGLAIAPTLKGQEITPYVDLFNESMIVVTPIEDYRSMKWSKALFNFIGNASSAILDMRPSIIYKNPRLFSMEIGMLHELLAVMKQQNIPVVRLASTPARLFAWGLNTLPRPCLKPVMQYVIDQGRGNKWPSFNLDMKAGRRVNEVVYHNDAVARIGRENGIAVPINTALSDVLLKLVNGEQAWEEWQERPDKLITCIKSMRYE